jgi:hypothetical protein
MEPGSGPLSFKGTLFYVWKGNRPVRIYVADGRVYFIGRKVGGINPGTAAALGGQFGLIGGLAAGLAGAAKMKSSPDLVDDDDPAPPAQLLAKHADNYALAAPDIVDPRIEAKGKVISFGPNAGRWHFTRKGDEKETVVLFETPDDASNAVYVLAGLLGSRLRNETDIVGRAPAPPRPTARMAPPGSGTDIITNIPIPKEQLDIVNATQSLTALLAARGPAGWQKIRCEVRPAGPGSPKPLEIVVGEGDALRPDSDPAVYDAAIRLARKLSTSIKTFPGVAIEMTRIDQDRWQNNMRLMDRR